VEGLARDPMRRLLAAFRTANFASVRVFTRGG
jgi:hypothetical protein